MTIVMARELERARRARERIAPVACTRLTEDLDGRRMSRRGRRVRSLRPRRTSPRPSAGSRPTSRTGINGQVVKVQGGIVPDRQGWRPLTEVDDRQAVDDRVDRRGAATRCFAKSDAGHPAVLLQRSPRLTTRCSSRGAPRTRRSAPSSIAFLDEHAPPRGASSASTTPTPARPSDDRDHPRVGARLAGHAVRPRLDDPGLPTRARRPERHAGPDARLPRGDGAARGIPRSLHFPGYAIVAPSLLEFGNDEQQAARAGRDPRRHDLVHRHERAQRGLRPRRAADARRCSTATASSSTARRCGRATRWSPQKCFCYVRTDPDAPKHKGISLLIVDMDTPGIEVRPLRHITGAADFAEVFFTDVVVPRENLVGELNDGWRITRARSRTSAPGCGSRASRGSSRRSTASSTSPAGAASTDDPVVRRRIAAMYEQAACLRALGYKGFASFAQGTSAPEHSYMKLATSELGQGSCYELGMELQGAYGAVIDPRARRGERPLGRTCFFVSFANTIAGGSSRDPAQHHRPARPRTPAGAERWTSPSPTNRSCCATRRGRCSPTSARRSLVRAHIDDPAAADALWAHLREFAALGDGPLRRPVPVPRGARATSPRPGRSSRPSRWSRRCSPRSATTALDARRSRAT